MKALSRAQIREIDRRAIEDYGIPGVVLMENAGRNAALVMLQFLNQERICRFCILCGRGNNGGDGFVIARHLHNLGHTVNIVLVGEADRLAADARINHDIVSKMDLPIYDFESPSVERLLRESEVVVDALLGTGFSGEVRAPYDRAIELMNSCPSATRVAIDVPSGLDCDTGAAAVHTLRADLTVTFVARKRGFDIPPAPEYAGKIVVADIGAPRELLDP